MKRALIACVLVFAAACWGAPQRAKPAAKPAATKAAKAAPQPLRLYFIDVEGGASTLIVTPAGESLLFDCGWPRPDGRDAKRIVTAAHELGLTHLDYLVTTHYHVDHWGSLAELVKLIPIGKFYDHGRVSELVDDKQWFPKLNQAYTEVTRGQSQKLNPGDEIHLERAVGTAPLWLEVLVADRQVRKAASVHGHTGGPQPNPECANPQLKEEDPTENARSIGSVLTFGKFRFLDLGDLTWNIEQKLVCPSNLIGKITLYQVTHHGLNISNNPTLLRSVSPQVAVMNNGARKGGSPDVVKWLRAVPGIQDVYQLHRNVEASDQENVPAEFIANPGQEQGCAGYGVKVEVAPDGDSYTVTNQRTGQTRKYIVK